MPGKKSKIRKLPPTYNYSRESTYFLCYYRTLEVFSVVTFGLLVIVVIVFVVTGRTPVVVLFNFSRRLLDDMVLTLRAAISETSMVGLGGGQVAFSLGRTSPSLPVRRDLYQDDQPTVTVRYGLKIATNHLRENTKLCLLFL